MINQLYLIAVPNMNKITTFFPEIANTQNLRKNNHNYSNLTQSQIVFHVNEQPLVPDPGKQYEEIPLWRNAQGLTDKEMD